MICPYCGKENVDRSPFCSDCGKSLAGTYGDAVKAEMKAETAGEVAAVNSVNVDNGVQIPAQTESVRETDVETVVEAPAEAASTAAASSASQASPTPPPPPQEAPQPSSQPASQPNTQYQQPQTVPQGVPYGAPTKPVYAQGCLGAAWKDITSSEGWFKKILLLGLIMCVPILNFYVYGYCMRWARQLVLGKIDKMPKKIFEEGNFSQGFYAFVWIFVFGLVVSIASTIFGFIPILGAIAVICLGLFAAMFELMGTMRVAISKNLGRAFDIKEDWRGFTKNFGSLFCLSIVPQLTLLIPIFVGALMIMPMIFATVWSEPFQGMMYSYSGYGIESVLMVISTILMFLPAFLLYYVFICLFEGFVYVWTYRAVGHYVARELPDWSSIAPQFEP